MPDGKRQDHGPVYIHEDDTRFNVAERKPLSEERLDIRGTSRLRDRSASPSAASKGGHASCATGRWW